MKNKKNFNLNLILSILPIIVVILIYNNLPELIPAHFNLSGDINRLGNKIEIFIVPIMILFIGLSSKSEFNHKNPQTILLALLILNLVVYFQLYESIFYNNEVYPVNPKKVLAMGISVIMIILGLIFKKCDINSICGIRIKWTLQDKNNWKYTHLFSSKLWVILGVMSIPLIIYMDSSYVVSLMIVNIVVASIVSIYYSYKLYKRDKSYKQ